MSAWSSDVSAFPRHRALKQLVSRSVAARRFDRRTGLCLACLICVLVAEGIAITHSDLWAAPLLGVLVVAIAIDIPLVPFLGAVLLVRVLTDASLSSQSTRHSGSINLSSAIAILFILVAIGLILRRWQSVWPITAAALFIGFWTVIAVRTNGASAETIREGVREASMLALGVIVLNGRRAVTVSIATRLVQVVGLVPALLALYQFATHTGMRIEGHVRAYGTFNHPDGAAMFFAIATIASLWQYMDNGHRRSDLLLTTLFAAAATATFSLTGLAGLLAMLMVFGSLRPGAFRLKLGAYAVAALIIVAFVATPLGAERLANESSNSSGTSLAWRLYKWGTLIPEWERAPFLGQGLGTTVTSEGTALDTAAGLVPHNEYLRYLVETGVVGLTILLGAIALLISRLASKRRSFRTSGAATLGIAINAGCLVDALADNTFLYTTTGYAVALIMAAILASPRSPVRRTARVYRPRRQVQAAA